MKSLESLPSEAAIRAVPTAEVLSLEKLVTRLIELSVDQAKVGAGRAE